MTQPDNTPSIYEPVFLEHFNGTALDLSRWSIADGKRGYGQETFRSSQVSVHDSLLDLTCSPTFDSGEITTKGKHSFTYGWYEASLKSPMFPGQWPAFWMMDSGSPQATWGEFDIDEQPGGHRERHYCHVHNGVYPGGKLPEWGTSYGNYLWDLSLGFHRSALDWLPPSDANPNGRADFYFDGHLFGSYANAPIVCPMHLLFSFSIRKPLANGLPPFGGLPDLSIGEWPAHYLIDWVWVLRADRHRV